MRKLIESNHVSLGGEIGSPQEWAAAYLDDEHMQYATELLFSADALLLGRKTYEGLSKAYPSMDRSEFVDWMNSIPKDVASTTIKMLSGMRLLSKATSAHLSLILSGSLDVTSSSMATDH